MEKKLFHFFRFFLISYIIFISLSISILKVAPMENSIQMQENEPINSHIMIRISYLPTFYHSFKNGENEFLHMGGFSFGYSF